MRVWAIIAIGVVVAIMTSLVISGRVTGLRRIVADLLWNQDPDSLIRDRIMRLRNTREWRADDVAFLEEWSKGTHGVFSYVTMAETWRLFVEDPDAIVLAAEAKKDSFLVSDTLGSGFLAYEEYHSRIPVLLRVKASTLYRSDFLRNLPGTAGVAEAWESFLNRNYPADQEQGQTDVKTGTQLNVR